MAVWCDLITRISGCSASDRAYMHGHGLGFAVIVVVGRTFKRRHDAAGGTCRDVGTIVLMCKDLEQGYVV